ncbi:MAG: HAMP domain-containing sensor histidine kinase [bacterium]
MWKILRRPGPWLFGIALVTLAALVLHWTTLLWRHESEGISKAEQALNLKTHAQARRLGKLPREPDLGPVPGVADLEVVRLPAGGGTPGSVRLMPRWPDLGVRPSPAALEGLRHKRRRRSSMLLGEGVLALVLFSILCLMLFRLLLGERQRRREIEAFINTMSHELKTPLAGIKALLGTLQMGNIPADRLQEFLDMGLREADRLEHLVENILIANRIRRSTLAVQLQAVDVGEFLSEFVKHRSALLPADHPGIDVRGAPGTGTRVEVDVDKLRVVLENLTHNALKYGEGKQVRVVVREEPSRVLLDVEDDGIGFEPDRAEELFGGLRAATRDQGSMVEGTGLGLGIARKLARAMGGELTAASRGAGQGSRFSVALQRSGGAS